MIIGYIYQLEDGKLFPVHLRAVLNKYMDEAIQIINNDSKIICRFIVKSKTRNEKSAQ